ncbi:cation transporter [Alicyclobacillus contaminans]|nr:cation transporter [Alicyclobacillus contaminans]
MKQVIKFFREDLLFSFSLLLAIIAIIFGRFSIQDINFKVIVTLAGLMLVISGLDMSGILSYFGQFLVKKSFSFRQLLRYIVLLSFFSSMFLTNDVAILTLLPIYLRLTKIIDNRQPVLLGTVYIIAAANLGSSFFPFGNPQNLFLYSYYHIPLLKFFSATSLIAISSLILLMISIQFIPKEPIRITLTDNQFDRPKAVGFGVLMLIMIGGVFGLIDYFLALAIVAIIVLFWQPQLFKNVDYRLLATFAFFFVIVGNLSQSESIITWLQSIFTNYENTLLGSILTSQVISNVPAAILLAPFTKYHQSLLLGVNIGGLGTLIASLANLIGYKIIRIQVPSERKLFLRNFYLVNGIFLLLLTLSFSLIS